MANNKAKQKASTKATVKSKKDQEDDYKSKCAVTSYYLVLMFSLFPLFYTNNYTNIRHDKLNLFLGLSAVFIIIQGIIMLYTVFSNRYYGEVNEVKWYQRLTIPDFTLGAFVLISGISTVFSKYPLESFTGTQGRNNGLMIMFVYLFVFLIISRTFYFKNYVFIVFGAASLIVFALCIMNKYNIDILGMYNGYDDSVKNDFTATIGNKNLMSAFCCIVVPVFALLYLTQKNNLRYFYLAVASIGFPAILCADSEGSFLGFVPFMIVILIYYIRQIDKLRDYFTMAGLMLLCGKILVLFGKGKKFGSMQSTLINSNIIYAIIIAFGVLALIFKLIDKKHPNMTLPRFVQFIAIGLLVLGVAGVVALIINYTFIDTKTPLSSLMKYLRFNEKWGTHRGFMWIKAFEIFGNADIFTKLFGTGPDTFYSAFSPYFNELNTKFGNSSTNCAHNEFINYLVTVGITGLIAYVGFIGSVIIRGFKYAKKNPLALVFAGAVLCYTIQSLVNMAQPITTPLFVIAIALSEAICRKESTKAF